MKKFRGELTHKGDYILWNGELLPLANFPLEAFWNEKNPQPYVDYEFDLDEGYTATWEISEGRLFLIGLEGWYPKLGAVSIKTFFPEAGDKVFASWFSGKLKLKKGKALTYFIYEQEWWLFIKEGFLITEQLIGRWAETNWGF